MSSIPPLEWDVKEAAESGLFTVPQLIERKSIAEQERLVAWIAGLADRSCLDLRTSVETCSDPVMLWELHRALMSRGIPPVLRGPQPWHLGQQGRFIEVCADVAWVAETDPGHLGRYRLARRIFKARWGTNGWWPLMLWQFERSDDVRGLVLALGLTPMHRLQFRSMQTAQQAQLFEKLHGANFSRLVHDIESALMEKPDKSGRTDPHTTATRRAQLWRIHRLLGAGPAATAKTWAALSGEALGRQRAAKQLAATAVIGRTFERSSIDITA